MQDALAAAARRERRETSREAFARLDALSRTRALTNAETTELARAIKIIDQTKNEFAAVGWTAQQDEQLLSLRTAGKTFSAIGEVMGISKASAAARFDRLRRKGAVA